MDLLIFLLFYSLVRLGINGLELQYESELVL